MSDWKQDYILAQDAKKQLVEVFPPAQYQDTKDGNKLAIVWDALSRLEEISMQR
jgi:hypothetical protein